MRPCTCSPHAPAQVFQLTLSKSYGVAAFLDDLRGLYRLAGSAAKGVMFIMTDSDVKDEQFLEYINAFLMTGEVRLCVSAPCSCCLAVVWTCTCLLAMSRLRVVQINSIVLAC